MSDELEKGIQALIDAVCASGFSIADMATDEPTIITAPDAIPLSDSEYAGLPLGTNCPMG